MKQFRLLILTLLFAINAQAVSTPVNATDQWAADGENGWGISALQQGDRLFLDLFVYGSDGKPTWLVVGMELGDPSPSGHQLWTGDVFQLQGTYYGAPWNPANLVGGAVGSATFDVDSSNSATLSYNVGGVSVVKHMTRNTFASDDYSGAYFGALVYDATNCGIFSGHQQAVGDVVITQTGDGTFGMAVTTDSGTCTYNGTLATAGHLGSVAGNYSCADSSSGTFTLGNLEINAYAFSGSFAAHSGTCAQLGHVGGTLR